MAWNPESNSVLDSLTWGEKRTGETDFSTSLIVLIQVYNWEMSGTTHFNWFVAVDLIWYFIKSHNGPIMALDFIYFVTLQLVKKSAPHVYL